MLSIDDNENEHFLILLSSVLIGISTLWRALQLENANL